jgi:hypothetical protein
VSTKTRRRVPPGIFLGINGRKTDAIQNDEAVRRWFFSPFSRQTPARITSTKKWKHDRFQKECPEEACFTNRLSATLASTGAFRLRFPYGAWFAALIIEILWLQMNGFERIRTFVKLSIASARALT